MKIQTLLDSENKWCKHSVALAADGEPVYERNPRAVSWCLVGAVLHCYPEDGEHDEIFERIDATLGKGTAVWNDAPERTFAEVRKLVETLDI